MVRYTCSCLARICEKCVSSNSNIESVVSETNKTKFYGWVNSKGSLMKPTNVIGNVGQTERRMFLAQEIDLKLKFHENI